MLTGHRPAVRRRRSRKSRAARIAVPLAIPMALGLTLGIVMAVTGGNHTTINQAANTGFSGVLGGHRGAFGRGNFGGGFRGGQASRGGGGDLANPNNAQDAAGNAINPNQTAAEAAASMNCTLAVPANPLSAKGLATPYQLGDGCDEAVNGATEGAFVEATILAPDGQVQVYDPVVVNAGTQPAVAPTPPTITRGSQIIISMGFNGNALVLTGRGARQGNCIDALGNSVINQTPQCNAANFYRMANAEIANGTLVVPPVGTSATDGQACETSESFALIDQDQSDNVDSAYLVNPTTGQVAQNNAANAANLQGFTTLSNGSDSGALANFVDPSLGCQPFTATNTTSAAGTSSSQALTALSAAQNQPQTPALLPVNDPQLLVAGQMSIAKTNVYRAEVDQPLLARNTNVNQNAANYCQDMVNLQTPKLKLDATVQANTGSPVPAIGNNLATFLAARESASFANLNCQNFALTNPVTLTLDGNGVATAATFNVTQQTANANGGAAATASASASASASATAAATAPATVAPTAAATTPAATTPTAAATTPAAAATDTAAAGGAGN